MSKSAKMIPAGYLAKRVHKKPDWLQAPQVIDVYSVSNCVCEDFADHIPFWKHNGYCFFDSPEIIKSVAKENLIPLEGTSLFYYEAYEMEFDGESWHRYSPEASFPTSVVSPTRSNSRVSTWSIPHLEARQNVPAFRAVVWRETFVQMPIVCWSRSTRQRRMSATERLMNPSRVGTEYFLFIR